MSEMEKVLKETSQTMDELNKLTPDRMAGFKHLVNALKKEKSIDPKNRELITVALSVATHCKWCITTHVKRALDEGASRDEILQAAWLAVLMGGGPALMYSQFVIKALKEFRK